MDKVICYSAHRHHLLLFLLWSYSTYFQIAVALVSPCDDITMSRDQHCKTSAYNNNRNSHDALLAEIKPLGTSPEDAEIIWKMLMLAAHETSLEHVKSLPILKPYAEDFGQRQGDIGVVATIQDGIAVGAAWVRVFSTGGGLGTATAHLPPSLEELKHWPELAIAVVPEHRGHGIGSFLLRLLLDKIRQEAPHYPGICLSCREENQAMKLYERTGFIKVPGSEQTNRTGGTSITMRLLFGDAKQLEQHE
jgi:GNAT superfamily N-acetyltransferase